MGCTFVETQLELQLECFCQVSSSLDASVSLLPVLTTCFGQTEVRGAIISLFVE